MTSRFWKIPKELTDKATIDVDSSVDTLLFERYLKKKKSILVNLPFDYTIIPPKIRTKVFDTFLKFKKDPGFPRYPTDLTVEALRASYIHSIRDNTKKPVPYIWFWPKKHESALCLTHDCDSQSSFKNIMKMRAIEKKYGFVSSWNFVPNKYRIRLYECTRICTHYS